MSKIYSFPTVWVSTSSAVRFAVIGFLLTVVGGIVALIAAEDLFWSAGRSKEG